MSTIAQILQLILQLIPNLIQFYSSVSASVSAAQAEGVDLTDAQLAAFDQIVKTQEALLEALAAKDTTNTTN